MMIATAGLLLLPALQAASASPLTPGVRVRVTVRESGTERTLVGRLRTFDDSTLTIVHADRTLPIAVARPTIAALHVGRGHKRHLGTGLLLGAVAGLAALALIDSACGEDCDSSPNEAVVVGGAVLAGGIVGALVRTERWESVPWAVGAPRRSGLPPGRRGPPGVTVGLSLRF